MGAQSLLSFFLLLTICFTSVVTQGDTVGLLIGGFLTGKTKRRPFEKE